MVWVNKDYDKMTIFYKHIYDGIKKIIFFNHHLLYSILVANYLYDLDLIRVLW